MEQSYLLMHVLVRVMPRRYGADRSVVGKLMYDTMPIDSPMLCLRELLSFQLNQNPVQPMFTILY